MTRQVALATCLAAAFAVFAAALAALGFVRHAYDGQARAVLRREAILVAEARTSVPNAFRTGRPAGRVLRASGITVVRVRADGASFGPATVDPADVAAAGRGDQVSAVRRLGGSRVFVEVQPVPGDGGVLLLERASDAQVLTPAVLRRLLLALLLGLGAAALLGVVVARRLTRPLVRAAEGAHRLAAGERDVRLAEDGPAEVAELSGAMNRLTDALAGSESRQRDFLLSISHELRTPLTAIRGYAEALGDEVATGAGAVTAGRTIEAEAQRLERLVSDLLDLARLGAQDFRLEPSLIDLTEVVRAAAAVWSTRCAGEGVPFRADLPAQPLLVHTDAGRVRQVLDGLAENALRVTPTGCPITFSLSAGAGGAVLQVRDGGPGLTEDDIAVAFERSVLFNRYRGVRRVGTGLGLALVGGLVGRLGGRVSAGHAPEGGAAFTVTLPLPGA